MSRTGFVFSCSAAAQGERIRMAMERAARAAGDMLLAAAQKGTAVHQKDGIGNFVTDCDQAVQRFLQKELKAVLPDAAFVGEEDGQDAYCAQGACFIVDPIDGTANFIRSLGCSVVSIALVEDGEARIGVVCNPFSGELFSAERGRGASLNGRPIHVSRRTLQSALVSSGMTSYQRDLTERTFRTMAGMFERCEDLRMFGSAALDICQVAAGRLDAFWELRLHPWDYAGAGCILREAGGQITTAEGGPLPFDQTASVLAANAVCYEDALAVCLAARGE